MSIPGLKGALSPTDGPRLNNYLADQTLNSTRAAQRMQSARNNRVNSPPGKTYSVDLKQKVNNYDSIVGQNYPRGFAKGSTPMLDIIKEGSKTSRVQTAHHRRGKSSQANGITKLESETSSMFTRQPKGLNYHGSGQSNNPAFSQQHTAVGGSTQAKGMPSQVTSIDQISPELAAQIVKSYILPMFESDGKKQLKSKYNRMQGIASQGGKFKQIAMGDGSQSVYGELKLSEKLHNELDIVREQVDRLNENLEDVMYQRDTL